MSEHRLTVESVTMEQQSVEEVKPKVSRSAARHIRRKRLTAARREAEKCSPPEQHNSDDKLRISLIQEIPESVVCARTSNSKPTSKVDCNNVKHKNVNINTKRKDVSDLLKNKNNVTVSDSSSNDDLFSFDSELSKTNLSKHTVIQSTILETCEQQSSNSTILNNSLHNTSASINHNLTKMDPQEKLREQVKTEREARKAAKAAAKTKVKVKDNLENESSAQLDKGDKPKAQDRQNVNIVGSEIETTTSESLSKKQIITQNVDIDEKKKTDDKNKVEEKKKTDDKKKVEDNKKTEDKQKTEEKSKAELRAERRAKQEAQRASKQALLNEKKKPVKTTSQKIPEKSATASSKEEPVKKTLTTTKSEIKDNPHEVNLFKHLYIKRKNISQLINRSNVNIHPAIIRLGVQYAEKVIVGSNARCVALLAAIKQLIEDFERPSQADFTRGLEASLQESMNYLNFCRPSAVSMQNALKHLKWQMSTLPSTVPDGEAKSKLGNAIDTYIQEQILLADKAISNAIQKKILNGDVILTYGFSSLIYKILCDAYTAGKQFRVVVIDGRPWLEGKELLRRLVKHGIDCSYMLINALSFIMPQVSKVFLGAHAILANGAVMSRVGTAQVALIANAFNVPVLVACETHKSCERVQTDSIVYNEIGDPDQLIKNSFCNTKKSCLSNWKTRKTLNLLNITYDVTPADLVTAVVTELAILPCTSVPVILRIKPSEI